jgi:hypothetical protein
MSYFAHIRALTMFIAFSLLLLQPSAFAQEQEQEQQKYKEFLFFFSPNFYEAEPADEECAAALAKLARKTSIQDINPNNNGRVKIYSVALGKKGQVTDDRVEEIGEMLVCQDFQTYPPEMNLVPIYYEITIGSRTFIVAGAGTSIEFPDAETLPGGGVQYVPIGFPNPNRTVLVYSGTVLPAVPGMRGGSYTDSRLGGPDGESEDGLSGNIVSVLRVVLPDNP